MKNNNKNLKSGMSLAIMLGSMAIIASVFGYFVCSWFLDYVTAPKTDIESVSTEQIVTEEKIEGEESLVSKENDVIANREIAKEDKEDKEEDGDKKETEGAEKAENTMVKQSIDEDLFVVQVGAFSSQNNAQGLVDKLQVKGFTAYITSKDPYRVQVGAFRTKPAAEELKAELENHGFPVYIKN